ncbi:hypothetical protein GCM10010399_29840 [Dactylosporangium fulvum]|uniref:Uncharacterized protein n=1 Tax=Dactylosporangium fulvum TaxID=53359 RepID=A0ABY5W1C2_9ACTN|nr:hypothetical protein [Dactylosporangium fulvum]UWP83843.1 hypothetical protein Dfulv_06170 [Dactylosporangium fulvum]
MTVPTTPPGSVPYATLLSFTRYVGRTGPRKASFVGGLRRQRESGSGFNPHGQLVKALKADIQFRTGGTYLNAVVEQVNARWKPLYESVVPGALKYLESLDTPVEVTPTRDTLGMVGSLPVKINPHFGLRYADGRGEAVRLHFDEDPPQDEAAVATLHLMTRHMDLVLPNATPVLVDIRRGDVLRPDPTVKPKEVERWLAGEAAAFSAMWGATA